MSYVAPIMRHQMRVEDLDFANTTGVELMTNYNFASGDLTGWTEVNSPDSTVTADGGASGGYYTRIDYLSTNFPGLRQNPLLNNRRYRFKARVRGDGTRYGILNINAVEQARFLPSTDWQFVEFEANPTGTSVDILSSATSTNQGYIDIDYLTAEALEARTLDSIGGAHAVLGNGAQIALWPNQVHDIGFNNFGTSRYLRAADVDLTGVSQHTFSIMVKGDSVAATQRFMNIEKSGSDYFGQLLRLSTGGYRYYSGGASSANAANIAHSISDNSWVHVIGLYDGVDTKIFLNGDEGTDAASPLAPAIATGQMLTIGTNNSGSQPWGGALADASVFDYALDADERYELGLDMRRLVSRLYI